MQTLRTTLRRLGRFGPLIGRSDGTQHVYDMIERNARSEAAVLVWGEAGTGKEATARALHDLSRRRKGPFIKFDCRAALQLPRVIELGSIVIESMLFGRERGSYGGAERREPGLFEQASGGTLLLKDVTALPLSIQESLLRALDSQSFMRIGGSTEIATDFRLIATSRRPAREALDNGTLREDLWLRLDAASIALPPLRDREDDMLQIAEALVADLNLEARKAGLGSVDKRIAPEFIRECLAYDWPFNVRELRERVRLAYEASGDFIETCCAPTTACSCRAPR
ncbi:MAG: DNA-binding transcriptional regulator NtrC [Burkholderia gladioli]|nr:MAG: DNA-binding transcriptional regulator NtrC [Burkholderia gladioli]